MEALFVTQNLLSWLLSLALLALVGFCLVDALRARADAFPATSNQSKTLWLVLLGVSTAVCVITLPGIGMFNLIAVVIGGVYLARVRPAIREITGSGRGAGPYGGW